MSAKKKAVTKTKTKKAKAVKTKKAAKKPAAEKTTATKKKVAKRKATKLLAKSASDIIGGLTANERQHLAELIDQGRAPVVAESTGKLSVMFYVQDGHDKGGRKKPAFTVAMVAVGGELKGVGVAKLNPKDDEWSEGRGRLIALARAVRAEAKEMR